MARKTTLSLLMALLVAAALIFSVGILQVEAQPRTWTVDDDGPADFNRIQDAINAANAGDTIFVHSGTYHEHVILSKTLTLLGENKSNTVIDASSLNATAIKVMANNVLISGFTIQRGQTGVFVQNSNGVTISNNKIFLSEFEGISIYESEDDIVTNNLITTNDWDGIYLFYTRNSELSRNIISSNHYSGMYFENSSLISVVGNHVSNHSVGIYMYNVANSAFYHNNFINNTSQVLIDVSSNAWDNGVEGNFWSDYSGSDRFSGSSQNVAGSDGLGDNPYPIDPDNGDNYPLMGEINFFDSGIPASGLNFVHVVSNSTVTGFHLDSAERKMSFNVMAKTSQGFCRVSIPKAVVDALWPEGYRVAIDGGAPPSSSEWTSETYTYSYLTFSNLMHEVVFEAADVRPPTVTILSPENKSYSSRDISLISNLSEPTSWIGYSLDGQANVTLDGNTTITSLSDGAYRITVFANDTVGNMGRSDTVYFSVDTVVPTIAVTSPQNKTYTTTSVSLIFDVSESTSWTGFSIDGQANETALSGNTIISDLSNGVHSLMVYAEDGAGNMGSSERIVFTVNVQGGFMGIQGDLLWILIAAAVVAIFVVASLLVYFGRIRKRTSKAK